MPGPPGPTGPAGTIGPAGPRGSDASIHRFFVQDGNTAKTINITNDDLNKIWFVWLGNGALNLRLPSDLLRTGGVQTSLYHESAWVTVVVVNTGTSAQLLRPDGTSMTIPFTGNQLSTLSFMRYSIGVGATGEVSVNRAFYSADGSGGSTTPSPM